MKYDSGMKSHYSDIIAGVKSMLGKQGIEEVKPYIASADPKELREYLKEEHGCCKHGGSVISDMVDFFDCTPNNFKLTYKEPLNNEGDKELILSWSQLTTFIRSKWNDIYGLKDKVKEAMATECECPYWHTEEPFKLIGDRKLSVSFECTKHKCDVKTEEDLQKVLGNCAKWQECPYRETDFPCDSCQHDVNGCCDYPDTPDDYCVMGDKQILKENDTEIATNDTLSAVNNTSLPETITEDKPTIAVFDYSELDAETAVKLENVAAKIFNIKRDYIFALAKEVAYAHDLLANHYGGKFGKWCESIGINRRTGNNLVHVVKLFHNSTEDEQKNLEQLAAEKNVKLLYEAARPSAPVELVAQVKNGDITTHKEYIELKNKLKESENKLAEVKNEAEEKEKHYRDQITKAVERADNAEFNEKKAKSAYAKASSTSKENYEKYEKAQNRVYELSKEIDRLNSRVMDVAVLEDEKTLAEKDNKIAELNEELSKLKEQLEGREEAEVRVYAIRLTNEQYEKLTEIVDGKNYYWIAEAIKNAQTI